MPDLWPLQSKKAASKGALKITDPLVNKIHLLGSTVSLPTPSYRYKNWDLEQGQVTELVGSGTDSLPLPQSSATRFAEHSASPFIASPGTAQRCFQRSLGSYFPVPLFGISQRLPSFSPKLPPRRLLFFSSLSYPNINPLPKMRPRPCSGTLQTTRTNDLLPLPSSIPFLFTGTFQGHNPTGLINI